jgi:hypothetical protein
MEQTSAKIDLSPETLRALAARRDSACVSLFSPLNGVEPEKTNRTRLENLVSEAEDALREQLGPEAARRMMKPVRAFVGEGRMDPSRGRGIAIFADSEGIRCHYVPWALSVGLSVGDRFYVKPLAPAQTADPFYVVAMSKDHVRAFRADRSEIEALDAEDLPTHGVDDVPGGDGGINRLQSHAGKGSRSPRTRTHEAIFHGHRDDTHVEHEVLARVCRQTSEALRKQLPRRDAPVVIVAVERLASMFRDTADWMNVVAVVEGNPDDATPAELHHRCLPAFELYLEREMTSHAEELGDAIHHGLGSTELEEIVIAANDGRVDTLFLDRSHARWGHFDPAKRRVDVHAEPKPGDEDLVDLAVAETLARGGSVVPAVPQAIGEPIAALYRHA